MKDKLLNIAEWYDCFNEHPEVIPFTPSKVCRNWRNGDVKQKAWVALAVFILCSVGLFQWIVYLVTVPMAFINEWAPSHGLTTVKETSVIFHRGFSIHFHNAP